VETLSCSGMLEVFSSALDRLWVLFSISRGTVIVFPVGG